MMFVWTFVETVFDSGQPGKTLDAIHLHAFPVPISLLYLVVGIISYAAGRSYENRKYLYIGLVVCVVLMFYYPFSILLDPPSFLSPMSAITLSNNWIVPTGKEIHSVVLWVITARFLLFGVISWVSWFFGSKA